MSNFKPIIRPLNWQTEPGGLVYAETAVGRYAVSAVDGKTFIASFVPCNKINIVVRKGKSIENAMSICNDHWDRYADAIIIRLCQLEQPAKEAASVN